MKVDLPTLESSVLTLVQVRRETSGQYVAQAIGLPEIHATAASAEEAIAQVRAALVQWLAAGKLVVLTFPAFPPRMKPPGWAKDDLLEQEFLDDLARMRQEDLERTLREDEQERSTMLHYLFDTDHLTLYDHADALVWRRFSAHSQRSVGISAVTVEEALRGRLAALSRHTSGSLQVQAYAQLLDGLQLFQQFALVAFDPACENQYQQLRSMRLRIGSQDLRIAAITLAHRLILVSRNRRDFARIPGLSLEDWSV